MKNDLRRSKSLTSFESCSRKSEPPCRDRILRPHFRYEYSTEKENVHRNETKLDIHAEKKPFYCTVECSTERNIFTEIWNSGSSGNVVYLKSEISGNCGNVVYLKSEISGNSGNVVYLKSEIPAREARRGKSQGIFQVFLKNQRAASQNGKSKQHDLPF